LLTFLIRLFHEEDWKFFPVVCLENFLRGPCVQILRLVTKQGQAIHCYCMMLNEFDAEGTLKNFTCGFVPTETPPILYVVLCDRTDLLIFSFVYFVGNEGMYHSVLIGLQSDFKFHFVELTMRNCVCAHHCKIII
jgi:hypothetical protein